MELSEDTQKVLEFLDNYSESGIRKRNDIASILEISASYNLHTLFNNIVFTGKSIWNLFLKIRKIDPNQQEGSHLIRNEFSKQLEEIIVLLNELINVVGDEQLNQRFEAIYFVNSKGAVKNLIDLAHDLSLIKDIQTQSKKIN